MQQRMEEPEMEKDRGEEETAPVKKAPPAGKSPKQPEAEKESGFNRFIRRAARTLLVAGVLFAAGMVTSLVAFQRPKVTDLEGQVEDLSAQVTDLEGQVETLESEVDSLQPFEEENRVLKVSLAESDLHVRVLSALKDVQAAQLALALGEVDAARLNLSRTEDKLEEMGALLPVDQQGVVEGMVQRLTLVLEGMDGDAFAAQSDLDVLENSLVQLENTLFTGP